MTEYREYYKYLLRRKKIGLWYRDHWLYPRISRHLSGRVLDIGCGIGDFVRHRPHTIGADVNPEAVDFCCSRGLSVQLMQPDQLPFDDSSFDGGILDNVLEHLTRPEPLLAEIHRVVRIGGHFVVGVPGSRGFESDPDHKRHYPEAALIPTVENAGFELAKIFYQPFYSRLLDRRFRYYAIYGIFRRT